MSKSLKKSNLMVGAFSFFVIAAFIVVVLMLQVVKLDAEGAVYSVRFADVGGLSTNSGVYVAGQRIGKVETIDTRPVVDGNKRRIEVDVRFRLSESYSKRIAIPVDTQAAVQSGGFFGAPKLVLLLGDSDEMVPDGKRLPKVGKPPVELNELLEHGKKTMGKLDKSVENLNKILGDENLATSVNNSLKSLEKTLATLEKGLETIEPAFDDVPDTVASTKALIEDIKKLIEDNNKNITETLESLNSAATRVDNMLGDEKNGVPKLVGGLNTVADDLDTLVNNLNRIIVDNELNVQVSLENVRDTTESLRVFARRIEADPSLLVWGSDEDDVPGTGEPRTTSVDELRVRNSGRRPRKEAD